MDGGTPVGELGGAPGLEPDVAQEPAGTIRVVAFNVRHCRGAFSPFISESRTAAAVRTCMPDIAGLTEVYRWDTRDQPKRLTELTGLESAFFGVRPVRGGDYGNLLLSRRPLREIGRVALGGRGEPRGCLLAEVELESGAVTVGVTHLGLDRRSRRAQIGEIVSALPRDRPLILAGDFNCRLHEIEPLLDMLRMVPKPPPTFPSVRPAFPLDLVLFSPHFEPEAVEVLFSLASDHRPLVVELLLKSWG